MASGLYGHWGLGGRGTLVLSSYVGNDKYIRKMCTDYEVHIFNVSTIIMQSLNIKEGILLAYRLHKLGTT